MWLVRSWDHNWDTFLSGQVKLHLVAAQRNMALSSAPCSQWQEAVCWTRSMPPERVSSSCSILFLLLPEIYRHGGGGLVTKSCPILATPWTAACQAPLSMGFSRQEHWSGLPFPSPGDILVPGIVPSFSALQVDSLRTALWGKPYIDIDI